MTLQVLGAEEGCFRKKMVEEMLEHEL